MTFEEILNQAMALLQRQGRVSYRALKRQFDLDEAYIEDVKLERNYPGRLRVPLQSAFTAFLRKG